MPLYEIDEAGTRKFYRVEIVSSCVHLSWGRIGTAGQQKVMDLGTVASAEREFKDQCLRRLDRGYSLVHDEGLPHDAVAAREQEAKARLAATAPLTPAPRFLFTHGRNKHFVWLERQGDEVRSCEGALDAKGGVVAGAAAVVRPFGTEEDARRDLKARTAALLQLGYIVAAFGAKEARPKRKTVARSEPDAARAIARPSPQAVKPAIGKPWPPPSGTPRAFAGYSFAFFGDFALWPAYHGAPPRELAAREGAAIRDTVDVTLDCAVFGDLRGKGKADAKKKAVKVQAAGAPLRLLDEAEFRELVRIDLSGKTFAFTGGFDCSPGGLDDGVLARMIERAGAVRAEEISPALDYLVVGNRKGPSKVATQHKVEKLNAAGATITRLSETAFLALVRVDAPRAEGELDFPGFLSQLYGHANEGKLGRALAMLRTERHQLYASTEADRLVGVVKSQSGSSSVYASWLSAGGGYGCATPDLSPCMGLQGSTCKHLLVLIVGLARAGELPASTALDWVRHTAGKAPKEDRALCAETFIRYKGAEAGEIDWRPTETIPEDFYAV